MDIPFVTLSSNMTIIIAGLFLGVSLSLAFISAKSSLARQANIDRRLSEGTDERAGGLGHTKSSNVLARLARHITLPKPEEISKIRYLLSQAGFFSPQAVQTYFVIRVIAILVPQVLMMVFWSDLLTHFEVPTLLFFSLILAILSVYGPGFYISRRKKKRSLICREGFPDMMDLLIACIEAGLGLDAALSRVAKEIAKRYPPLRIAMDLMNLELRAGRPRHEAMVNFANRIDLDEARSLALMLKQSEEMGSNLGEALRTFSSEMRTKRMLRAEEKALALSAKLTVPLILFIFPTIMIMLLLPAGIRLAEGFS